MLWKVQVFHKRKHHPQSRSNADDRDCSLSVQAHVSSITHIDYMITSTIDSMNPNPSLHKGDAGDFTPIQEVERIQG